MTIMIVTVSFPNRAVLELQQKQKKKTQTNYWPSTWPDFQPHLEHKHRLDIASSCTSIVPPMISIQDLLTKELETNHGNDLVPRTRRSKSCRKDATTTKPLLQEYKHCKEQASTRNDDIPCRGVEILIRTSIDVW